jgi:hypothetical protein
MRRLNGAVLAPEPSKTNSHVPARRGAFEQAKKLFQEAFEKWKAGLPPGQLEESLVYKRQKGPTR